MKKFIYSRRQGSIVYNFYVDKQGTLQANYIRDSCTRTAIEINGIPTHLQQNLSNQYNIVILQKILRESFFDNTGVIVHINQRCLGGWKKKVHQHQTLEWLRGQLGLLDKEANIVARFCNYVDTWKNPAKQQGWHFNTKKGEPDGGEKDPRIKHAIALLHEAITTKTKQYPSFLDKYKFSGDLIKIINNNNKKEISLQELGKGLHPLQDIFAHTKKFIKSVKFKFHCFDGTDKPKCIDYEKNSPYSLDYEDLREGYSQRYTNTKLLTLYYVKCYQENKKISISQLSSLVREALALAKKPSSKQFQIFKKKLGLEDKKKQDFNTVLLQNLEKNRSLFNNIV